ncbi:MAG: 16S rRNA (cytidine(1402)-2'-O)-methyltransferase [Clostridiales bacterium]|nr:16S rRNA (cytidine(1402)-2'-O)-methyltransferase [Clostridiales bacterium]
MLYLVGTPIGNLGDMSPRAKEVLSASDVIACEDTRRTGLLLSQMGISGKLFSYHEHNKAAKGPVLVRMMKEGLTVSLVSDAGMPSISDPGQDLVRLCIDEGVDVSVVPGPVAAISALVLSGLDTRYYHFEGFLPSESKPRRQRLERLREYRETMVIYEAPHRLNKLIDELIGAGFGDNMCAFCRELTKKYEQVIRMNVNEAKAYFENTPPKGEFVLCLEPLSETREEEECDIDSLIAQLEGTGMSTKEIAAEVASRTGANKKDIYDIIVKRRKDVM